MSFPGVNSPALWPFICVAVSISLRRACLSPAQHGLPFPLCPFGNVCRTGGVQYLLVALLITVTWPTERQIVATL